MDIWGRLFKKRRETEAMVNRAIGAAEERARTPKGPLASAEWGEHLRSELFHVIEKVEAETGAYAFALTEDTQTLMVSNALQDALARHPFSHLVQPAFNMMFTTWETKDSLLEHWPAAVERMQGLPNSRDLLSEKAAILAGYVLNHFDLPCMAAYGERSDFPALEEEVEGGLKLEAAAAWYRLVDELAYQFIHDDRDLFIDYFRDELSSLLGLQGLSPAAVVSHAEERDAEYSGLSKWIGEPGTEAGTLMWAIGKHALAPLGLSKNALTIQVHSTLLLRALRQARVGELLTGEPGDDPAYA